ncbi:MAG: AAA family ATPase [Gemmatimonadota bacterium]
MPAEMIVFYGPPGTGKTYRAAREALRLIDGQIPEDPQEARARHNELVRQGRIFWVTFHPSYSYEDFVEGFRPQETERGEIVYRVVDGPFKTASAACRTWVSVGDRLGGNDRYEVVAIDAGGVVLRSEVDRADAVSPYLEQYADFWTLNRLRAREIEPDQLSLAGPRNEERQDVSRRTNLPTTLLTNSSHLRAVYEALQAAEEETQDVVLVIDEINRADLSRVFGELITLIELDKREGGREESSVVLPYSRTTFSVPAGLSILATMNTADRSLSVFDLALRRRFRFVEVAPEPSLCPSDYGGIPVAGILEEMNRRITVLMSHDLRLGHSDFMEASLEEVRFRAGWDASDDGKARAMASIIRMKVLPLLQEYFHGEWRRTDFVTGGGLLEGVEIPEPSSLPEDLAVDPDGFHVSRAADWWNPDSRQWDDSRFRKALVRLTV